MKTLWGIDLGGTKVEGVVLNADDYSQVLARERILTEAQYGYEHILSRISELIGKLKLKTGFQPTAVGIGTPGSIDPSTQLMKNSNTLSLNDKPLLRDLRKKLGLRVEIANDANCFAVAETNLGIVKQKVPDAKVVFGIIMGTGSGGGLVINGKAWNGKNGIGGEWGHNFLDESGGHCYCGKIGCVEMVIAGPALERYYREQTGVSFKMKTILERHQAGIDEYATATIQRMLQMFGKAVSVIINIIDPDAIVLGGGLGNIDLLYTEGVEELKKHVFNPYFQTPILKPALGDSAGVFGAALLVAE